MSALVTTEEKAASIDFINAMMKSAQDRGFVVHFDSEVELLQDMVLAAVTEAFRQAAALQQERMGAITGGLGGLGLPGV